MMTVVETGYNERFRSRELYDLTELASRYVDARLSGDGVDDLERELRAAEISPEIVADLCGTIISWAEETHGQDGHDGVTAELAADAYWLAGLDAHRGRSLDELNTYKLGVLLHAYDSGSQVSTSFAEPLIDYRNRTLDLAELRRLKQNDIRRRLLHDKFAGTGRQVVLSTAAGATLVGIGVNPAAAEDAAGHRTSIVADASLVAEALASSAAPVGEITPRSVEATSAAASVDMSAVQDALASMPGSEAPMVEIIESEPSMTPQASADDLRSRLAGVETGSVREVRVTSDSPDLTPEQSAKRRKAEAGISGVRNSSDRNIAAVGSISGEGLGDARTVINELIEEISSAEKVGGVSPASIHKASKLMIHVRQYTYDTDALSVFSDDEIEKILELRYIGQPDLNQKNLERLSQGDNEFIEWAQKVESKEDRELLLAIYASAKTSLLSGPELNKLVDYQYASVPDFVDTKIRDMETANSGEVTFDNHAEFSDEARFEALVQTMDELNEKALEDRRNGMSFGGWEGDIRDLAQIYWDTAKRHDNPLVTAEILMAQGFQESRFDSHAISPADARGIAQFMPTTRNDYRSWMGEHLSRYPNGFDSTDPAQAIDAQAIYMIWTSAFAEGNDLQAFLNQTLAGYNAGVGNLQRLGDVLVNEGLYINGVLETTEPADYQRDINKYLQLSFANLSALTDTNEVSSTGPSQAEELEAAGFTERTENMDGDAEMAPRVIDDGVRWHQYINQNADAIKIRLEENGLDSDLGSLHMCGLVTIEMIRFSEDGDIADDEEAMNEIYDLIIEDYITARQTGVFTNPDGGAMWHEQMVVLGERVGLDVESLPELSFKEIERAFKNGASYVTINTNPAKLDDNSPIKSGHIFAIRGITEDGKFLLADPASVERSQIDYSPEQILNYADLSAVHAMSAPGKMDAYKALLTEEREAAERAAREAEREAEKAEKEAEKAREKEERERNERAEEVRQNGEWDPRAMPDGWALSEALIRKYPVSGTLPQSELIVPVPGLYERMGDKQEVMLTPEAGVAFRAMNEAYKETFGENIPVNDSYRSFQSQEATKDAWEERAEREGKPWLADMAAEPGKSPHGYRGIDINTEFRGSDKYNWLIENGKYFGFFNPTWMHPGSPKFQLDEDWHFEFFGRATNLDDLIGGHPDYNLAEIKELYGLAP